MQLTAQGQRLIWVETRIIDRLTALRGTGESYSDVILRLVEIEARAALSVQPSLKLPSTPPPYGNGHMGYVR